MTTKQEKIQLPDSPFPGIDPFSYAERNVFFAREQESRTLIRLVVIHRGVLLYSDSGTGKSSLINAGLLPHAIAEGFQPERLRVQPRQDEEIIVERLSENARSGPPFLPSIFSTNDDDERVVLPVGSFLQIIKEKAQASTRPLLIFDQFEEWFTLFEEGARGKQVGEAQATQDTIRDAILSLLRDTKLPVKILLVLREDYLAKLTPFFKRYPNLPDQYLRLTALKGTEIKRIIRGPFEDYPGTYHPEIPVTLAQNIRKEFEGRSEGEPVRLSEVQIVCRALYDSGKSGDDLELYFEEQGGVQGILEQYLKQALESLPKNQRDPAVGLLSRMVTSAGTRNVISGEDVVSRVENEDGISRNILGKTLECLEQETKLVRRERRREVYYYEIASEFLVEWIRAKAKERAEKLKIAATEQALNEQKKRAEEQARIATKLRRRAIGMAVFFVIVLFSLGLLFLAWQKTKEAEKKQEMATLEKKQEQKRSRELEGKNTELEQAKNDLSNRNQELQEERDKAKILRKRAEDNLQEVKRLRRITQARSLAILAPLQQDRRLGALLAQQAYRYNETNRDKFPDEIYQALHKTLNMLSPNAAGPVLGLVHTDWVRSVAFSKKGELASGGADGRIIILQVKQAEVESDQLEQIAARTAASDSTAHDGSVRALTYSPDGEMLASGGDDHIVRLWHNNNSIALPGHRGSVWSLAFAPDGRWLASGGADSTVIVWRIQNPIGGKQPETLWIRNHGARIRDVAFNGTGALLASAGDDGNINLWKVRGKSLTRGESLPNSAAVRAIAFRPTTDQLLAGLGNGALWLWDLSVAGHPTRKRIFTHDDLVNDVAFSPTGDMFASASADESIRIWFWDQLDFGPVVLRDYKSWVWALAFNQDGSRLATGSSDNAIRIWITRPQSLAQRICAKVTRNLSFEEWQKYIGKEEEGFPYEDSCPDIKPAKMLSK